LRFCGLPVIDRSKKTLSKDEEMHITLSEKDLEAAPQEVKQWLKTRVSASLIEQIQGSSADNDEEELEDLSTLDKSSTEDLQPLSTSQARRLVEGLRPRSREFLKSIVMRNGEAKLSEVMKEMGAENSVDLRGPWAGITNRMRRVVNDRNAVLIAQDRTKDVRDGYGRVIESVYVMHSAAVNSLKPIL
jgi:hypothetical protein